MYNSGLNKRKYVLIGSAQILLQEKQKILAQKKTLVMSFNYPWKITIPPLEIPRPGGTWCVHWRMGIPLLDPDSSV